MSPPSPPIIQVAYETKDLDFMSASVVQTYLQDRWLGADYIANALQVPGPGGGLEGERREEEEKEEGRRRRGVGGIGEDDWSGCLSTWKSSVGEPRQCTRCR